MLAWEIPWTEEAGGVQSGVTKSWTRLTEHAHTHTHVYTQSGQSSRPGISHFTSKWSIITGGGEKET